MNTENIERVNFTKITQEVMKIIRTYGGDNKDLEKELFHLIAMVEGERRKADEIRELAFKLANKL